MAMARPGGIHGVMEVSRIAALFCSRSLSPGFGSEGGMEEREWAHRATRSIDHSNCSVSLQLSELCCEGK